MNSINSHDLISVITHIFYEHDPIEIAQLGAPRDEYKPEAKRLVETLTNETTQEELNTSIQHIFIEMFGELLTPTVRNEMGRAVWNYLKSVEI